MAENYTDPDSGLPLGRFMQVPSVRDSMGKTQLPDGAEINFGLPPMSVADPEDPTLVRFRNSISHWDNYNAVNHAITQMRRRNPYATAPELLFEYLLIKAAEDYVIQQQIAGGKTVLGGLVADFILPARWQQVEINGVAYHKSDEEIAQTRMTALGSIAGGVIIHRVTFLTDDALYRIGPSVLNLILAGFDVF